MRMLSEHGERSAIMQKLIQAADSGAHAAAEHEREHKKLQRERDAAQAEVRRQRQATEQQKQDTKVRTPAKHSSGCRNHVRMRVWIGPLNAIVGHAMIIATFSTQAPASGQLSSCILCNHGPLATCFRVQQSQRDVWRT